MRTVLLLLLGAALWTSLGACGAREPEAAANQTTAAIQQLQPETTQPPAEEAQPSTETTAAQEPAQDELVAVRDYIPGILVELKYATADNFTGQVIYDFQEAYLRYGTVKKLAQVQESLGEIGLGLKIWDSFRPVSAQFRLWEACPDPTYVANPQLGYSNHSRGNAVDVTLVDSQGNELEMPTGFDDFSALADRDYSDCGETAAENAQLLQSVMESYGFAGYFGEWWHFADETTYPVEETFSPAQ